MKNSELQKNEQTHDLSAGEVVGVSERSELYSYGRGDGLSNRTTTRISKFNFVSLRNSTLLLKEGADQPERAEGEACRQNGKMPLQAATVDPFNASERALVHCDFPQVKTRKKAAFTLAEVLITLGVIGIVAAMTLPTLIAKHQKKQTAIQLKKAYSMMSQALRAAEAEQGLIETWDLFPERGTKTYSKAELVEKSEDFINNYLKPHLKIAKVCAPTTDECWTPTKALNGQETNIKNDNGAEMGNRSVSFVLENGDAVYMWLGGETLAFPQHIRFMYDINGKDRGPSVLGKDVFAMNMFLDKRGLRMLGTGATKERSSYFSTTSSESCSKDIDSSTAGMTCGALIMFDGWEIKDDYPW